LNNSPSTPAEIAELVADEWVAIVRAKLQPDPDQGRTPHRLRAELEATTALPAHVKNGYGVDMTDALDAMITEAVKRKYNY
jgi:hypothetical protein